MDIAHILISLRNKLIEARKERDYRTLGELATVFTVFQEYAVEEQLSRQLIILLKLCSFGKKQNPRLR